MAQNGYSSGRYRGFFGEGHDIYHKYYNGLLNGIKGSCCNGKDGRPTQARWNEKTGTWDYMLNGEWRTMRPDESYKVLTPEVLAAQGRQRWDSQAHVFANESGSAVWCFIPPASGG